MKQKNQSLIGSVISPAFTRIIEVLHLANSALLNNVDVIQLLMVDSQSSIVANPESRRRCAIINSASEEEHMRKLAASNMLDNIATFFALNFEDDTYEFVETPLMKHFCFKPVGILSELEAGGAIHRDGFHNYCVLVDNVLERYADGTTSDIGGSFTTYLLTANKLAYLPVEVDIVFRWDEDARTTLEAFGSMSLAKNVNAIVPGRRRRRHIA